MSVRQVLIAGGAAVAIAAVVAWLGAVTLMRGSGSPGEATARFIPLSAQGYVSINLRPGAGQMRHGRQFISLLQTDEFLERRDELLEELEDEIGFHFLDDVMPWLGTDVSYAVLDLDPDGARWVLLAQIGDRELAVAFVEDLVSLLEDERHTEFERGRAGGADIWAAEAEGGGVALGVKDDYLVVADSGDTVEAMVRRIESPPSSSLANDPDFMAARGSLPAQRVMFAFVRTEEIVESLLGSDGFWSDDLLGMHDDEAGEAMTQVRDSTPEYLAASATFVQNGLRFDLFAEASPGVLGLGPETRVRAPEALPEDTLLLFSSAGLREIWEQFRESLEDADTDAADDLERWFTDFEIESSIDLEGDVIDSLTGEIGAALLPRGEIVLFAGLWDGDGIRDVLETLVTLMGLEAKRDSLGGYEVVTVEGFSFLVMEDWAVAGNSVDGLEAFLEAASGETGSLSSSTEFARLMDLAPDPLRSLVYGDVAGTLEMIEDILALFGMRSTYVRDVKSLIDPFGAVFVASSSTEEGVRISAVVTLRE